MKYSTYVWDLVPAVESASPASFIAPVKFIDSIHYQTEQEKSKEPRNEILRLKNCILLHLSMCTEPSANRGRIGTHLFDG